MEAERVGFEPTRDPRAPGCERGDLRGRVIGQPGLSGVERFWDELGRRQSEGEAAVFAAKARNTIAAATQNATGLGSVRNWNRSSLTAVASSRGRA